MTFRALAPDAMAVGWRRFAALGAAAAVFVLLVGLGLWQVQRLAWKTDLIARVEARLAAAPVPAPGPADWADLGEATDEYRRLTVTGHYLPGPDILVQAVTADGRGFWVMSALETPAGWPLLVNRGFVPEDRRGPTDRPLPVGEVTVTGLLRISQPGGGFLRANDPAADRWFSRDTAAIAAARGLTGAAPYFLDADAGPAPAALPRGGLTVVQFRNSHLGYALTWFALAALWAATVAFRFRAEGKA